MPSNIAQAVGNTEDVCDDVKSFVLQFLRTCRAPVTHNVGIWETVLPGQVAHVLNLPPKVRFTFDHTLRARDVIVIAHGSPTLDAMIHLTRQRGKACSLMFSGVRLHRILTHFCTTDPWSPEGRLHPLTGILSRINFRDVKVRIIERRILHQEELLFHFKVAYVSDERFEESHTVLINPITETVAPPIDLQPAVVLNLSGNRRDRRSLQQARGEGEASSYALRRLYRLAGEHLENELQPSLERHIEDARARLSDELTRINAYYHGLSAESAEPLKRLMRRMTAHQARAHLYPAATQSVLLGELEQLKISGRQVEEAYRMELGDLENERERRISELRERYNVRVEVQLTNVAIVRVPRVAWHIRLNGHTRRETTLLHDVLRDLLLDLDCDECDEPMLDVSLTRHGALVCHACSKVIATSVD